MTRTLTPIDLAKRAAAEGALAHVESGMRIGLGTGSTADFFTEALGDAVREGALSRLTCVPTSMRTGRLAEKNRLRLTTLDEAGWLDVTVDGADEVDGALSLIKGGGGALLQEKIVACASDKMVVIVDGAKRVETLGAFPLPIEIVPFGWETTKAIVEATLNELGMGSGRVALRLAKDEPFVTDGGHFILDLHLHAIADASRTAVRLNAIPGVIETGLFIDIADVVVVGHEDGRTETLSRN